MNRFVVYLIILGITLFTTFGDSFIKRAGEGGSYINWKFLFSGMVVYLITAILWFFIYKNIKFSIAGSVYGVFTALVFAAVGVFYFKESITAIEVVGMVMAVMSILILGRFN